MATLAGAIRVALGTRATGVYFILFFDRLVMDVATLTGAISVALGTGATGAYSTNTKDFDVLAAAGAHTGDRVWR